MFIDCLLWTRYCAKEQSAFASTDIPTNPIAQGEPWNRLPGFHALGFLPTSLAAPSQIPLLVSASPQSLNFASPQTQSSAAFSSPSMLSLTDLVQAHDFEFHLQTSPRFLPTAWTSLLNPRLVYASIYLASPHLMY